MKKHHSLLLSAAITMWPGLHAADIVDNGITYDIVSQSENTITVAPGNYSGIVKVPATVTKTYNSGIQALSWTPITGDWSEQKGGRTCTVTAPNDTVHIRCTFTSAEPVSFKLEAHGASGERFAYAGKLDKEYDAVQTDCMSWPANQLPVNYTVTPAAPGEHFVDFFYVTGWNSTGETGLTITLARNASYKVVGVSAEAFKGTPVSKVVLAEGIATIGKSAFEDCKELQEVKLPASLTSIGEAAFRNCSALTAVSVPGSIGMVSPYTFFGCERLARLQLGEGLTNISSYAFNACYALQRVKLPNSLTSIGNYAFASCTSLGKIAIPENVLTVWGNAFDGCSSLSEVDYNATAATRFSMGLEEDFVFRNCNKLTTVRFGANVKSIPAYVFRANTTVSNIYSYAVEPPALHNMTFNAQLQMMRNTLYVPSESKLAYRSASNWTMFRNVSSLPATFTYTPDPEDYGLRSLSQVVIGINFVDSPTISGDVSMVTIETENGPVVPEAIVDNGNQTFTLTFPEITEPGKVTVKFGAGLWKFGYRLSDAMEVTYEIADNSPSLVPAAVKALGADGMYAELKSFTIAPVEAGVTLALNPRNKDVATLSMGELTLSLANGDEPGTLIVPTAPTGSGIYTLAVPESYYIVDGDDPSVSSGVVARYALVPEPVFADVDYRVFTKMTRADGGEDSGEAFSMAFRAEVGEPVSVTVNAMEASDWTLESVTIDGTPMLPADTCYTSPASLAGSAVIKATYAFAHTILAELVTGIKEIESGVKVGIEENRLVVDGLKSGHSVTVYGVNGITLGTFAGSDDHNLEVILPAGIYIVKIATDDKIQAVKVVIR